MQIFNYLKGLFHRITRGQIKASCDLVIESLQKHTLPAYAQAGSLFKLRKISSKEGQDLIMQYKKQVRSMKGATTMVDSIHEILENTIKLLTSIGEKSDTLFNDVESTLGMTFQKAMYLRLISAATFADDFSRKVLNYLYVVETAHLDPKDLVLANTISPAERTYVVDNFANFALVMSILDNDVAEVLKQVDELPDAVVSEQSEHVLGGSLGLRKIDPLGFHGLALPVTVGVKWNPFYLIGMLYSDFRAAQYKCSKEELDLLQMRKLNLEKTYAKKPDARLQKQIEYMADRVNGLTYELTQMQEHYA